MKKIWMVLYLVSTTVQASNISDFIKDTNEENKKNNRVTGSDDQNVMLEVSPSADYIEICFKGSIQFDSHSANESTSGGNCVPGDIGFNH